MYLTNLSTYNRRYTWMIACSLGLFLQMLAIRSHAQPNLSFEIAKPKIYENRTLPSEKTGTKKFTVPRRLYNNTVSRFNYYFNANNKLNEALVKAKSVHQDDYTQLLSFYNYSLNETAKGQMDSIIYKCTAGILLHDLRSDWVDKLYLLMGKAYLYRRDFDSASNVFQYINYAFSPKDNGYDIPIGSNASNTNGVFTIATRESRSLWKRITSFPPSRNESFILQARTYAEQDQLTEAASLLELIRTDPNFPERLRADLHEMTAYVFYKQQSYGPAADELLQALDNAGSKLEKARWEYLAGQLYHLANRDDKAILLFERAIQHTADPLMDVYARMNIVGMAAATLDNAIQKNLDELLKMAKREKYETHRDIIYYAAAQLELKRKNYAAAEKLLLNSVKYSTADNPLQKQLSFLLLGDLNYPIKNYAASHRYYDSIQTVLLKEEDKQRVEERKPALKIISANQDLISREDSLQKIASLGAEERDAFLKKLLKQLRKEKGLKDAETAAPGFGNTLPGTGNTGGSDLFGGNGSEFYFQNISLKAKGSVDFKSRWGSRPNVDNWRRQTAVNSSLPTKTSIATNDKTTAPVALKKEPVTELSLDGLKKDIPLTALQIDSSNKTIIRSLLGNALSFQNQLEDYPSAIETYEELMRRFPETAEVEQALFNLAYCYRKNGDPAKADAAAAQLKQSFGKGKLASQLNNAMASAGKKNDPAEKKYQDIYNLFLSGRFEEAKEAKLNADKEFGKNYWTPQLLYIESIYYIKQKQDSTAINRLENIVGLFGKSPLAAKATTMIDVLRRRTQIENYLTNLKLDKTDDPASRSVDLNATNTELANAARRKDSLNIPKELKAVPKQLADISNTSTVSTAAVIKKDSARIVVPGEMKKLDLTNAVTAAPVENKTYRFNASDTQYVVVILNNVDPIFVTESRNAFNRYNQENYAEQKVDVYNRRINTQYAFLMFGPFVNAKEAMTYIDKTRPITSSRIIPWLTADKYSFSMISNANMSILINTQDIEGYHTFIHQVFPDKF
ncbi:MAG: tetratricopeptide repeat protein [Bacteroidota bacterium]